MHCGNPICDIDPTTDRMVCQMGFRMGAGVWGFGAWVDAIIILVKSLSLCHPTIFFIWLFLAAEEHCEPEFILWEMALCTKDATVLEIFRRELGSEQSSYF